MTFSLDSLEFRKLKELIGRYVSTDPGRVALERVAPSNDPAEIESEHEITAEAMRYLREHKVAFPNIPALSAVVEKVRAVGSVLEIPEIESVQRFLVHAEGTRQRWKDDRAAYPRLAATSGRLPDLRALTSILQSAIRDGEIDERYSPALARIRRSIQTIRQRLRDRLQSILRQSATAGQTQDDLITVRNGRYVIPIRTEQKRSFDGIVHGSSSSGATVFMEPLATLELNNDLVRLLDEENLEIARILAELTDKIGEEADRISAAIEVWAGLDLVFAKARFGREFDCTRPQISQSGLLSLIRARHPLLDDGLRREGTGIVPVSLDMDRTRSVLVISGPNAGGKTVVLKTVGLLSLMAQSGIPVPVEEAVLPVFDQVVADIGDQQSISNHLSTFSAHVLAVRSMIEAASGRTLILLDEIGSSTEPGEGAALGRAILEEFRRIGALTIATTHYNRLKVYAETTSGVANAAMEFDDVTLQPTYKLLHGLAGASSGLRIAERLGMPHRVLESAWSYLDASEMDAAAYVEDLRRRIHDLEKERTQLLEREADFEAWREREADRVRQQTTAELGRVEKAIERISREFSDRASRELADAGQAAVARTQRKIDETRMKALSEVRRESEKLTPDKVRRIDTAPDTGTIVPNTPVRVRSLGVTGTVIGVAGGEAEILIGNIKMRRAVSDLEVVARKPVALPAGVQVHYAAREMASSEINLVGTTVPEALDRLDKFLDDAFLAQLPTVRIVHGTGMGVLMRAVAEFLKGHPHVARFESAPPAQGGRGATVATLKE